MATDSKKEVSVSHGSESDARMMIVMTIADTTWRMFVPVIGMTVGGYFVDKLAQTRPAGVFTGCVLGIVCAVALVVMQYRNVTRQERRKTV